MDTSAKFPVLFILISIVATVLFLPGSILALAGGALFGPVLGTLYNLTGATVVFRARLIKLLRQASMLSVKSSQDKLDKGEDVTELDMRSAKDFVNERGHITQARNYPVEQLTQHFDELSDLREQLNAIV